jgi:hypothetical protein
LKESGNDYRWRLVEEKEYGGVVRTISNFLKGVFGKIKKIGRV